MLRSSFSLTILQHLLPAGILCISTISSAQSLADARRLTLNEQYEAASGVFRTLVTTTPGKGDYWFYFGKNLLEAENLDSARILFMQGIQHEPANPLNYAGMGIVAKTEGNAGESAKLFEKALQLGGGKNAEVLIRVAEAHVAIEKRDLPQAMNLLQQAEKLQPKNPEIQIITGDAFLENHDGSSAIKYYEKALALDPQSPLAMLRIGQLWTKARNYIGKDGQKGALEYFKEAVAIDPGFAPAYRELGEVYARAQRYQEAKTNYEKYLELSKGNLSARVRYASFLYLTKEYNASLNEIRQIWTQDTTKNLLNRLAAYSSYELKEYDNGLIYIEKFFQRQPQGKIIPSDYTYYGKLLSATGQDSLAILKLRSALEQDSSQTDLYSDMAALYAKLKQHDQAVLMYQKKIETGKPTTNDYFRMGQSYYNMKEFGKADTAFMKITESQPSLVVGHLWRGRANASLDPESSEGLAKPHYEEVVKLAESDTVKYQKELTEAYKYLGFYYYITKDYPNARTWWEKVRAILPDDQQAHDALEDMKGKK